MNIKAKQFKTVIKSKTGLFELNLKEFFQYKDLIWLFFKRNYSTRYKQTILGPLWLLIDPMMTVIMQSVVFGGIAGLSTAGVPRILFYMCSNTLWAFFSGCFSSGVWAFTSNSWIMGKIYFPRLVMPLSSILTGFFDFLIRMLLFAIIIVIYSFLGQPLTFTSQIALAPLFVLEAALFGLGFGLILAALTTKYRDLHVLVGFGLHLWMYGSPVVYTLDLVPEKYLGLYLLNPMAVIIDGFRGVVLGIGEPNWHYWGMSWIVTIVVLFLGVLVFNKTEKTFMDTV